MLVTAAVSHVEMWPCAISALVALPHHSASASSRLLLSANEVGAATTGSVTRTTSSLKQASAAAVLDGLEVGGGRRCSAVGVRRALSASLPSHGACATQLVRAGAPPEWSMSNEVTRGQSSGLGGAQTIYSREYSRISTSSTTPQRLHAPPACVPVTGGSGSRARARGCGSAKECPPEKSSPFSSPNRQNGGSRSGSDYGSGWHGHQHLSGRWQRRAQPLPNARDR